MKQITNKEYEEWQKYKPEIVTVQTAIIFLFSLTETAKPKIKPFCRLKIPWEYISSVRGFVTAVQASEL